MKWISVEQVRIIHSQVLHRYGGLDGIKDEKSLQAAIEQPLLELYGRVLYPGIDTKAARLLFCIITGHPFVDGNKRTAWLAFLAIMRRNNLDIVVSDDDRERTLLALADNKLTFDQLLEWVKCNQSEQSDDGSRSGN